MKVIDIKTGQLKEFSELTGARKLRDAELYDIRYYGTSGHTSLEFFRTDGQIKDVSGAIASTSRFSNMVTSGKFDEPFVVMAIGLFFIHGEAYGKTLGATGQAETIALLHTGYFKLEVNNTPVFERSPLGRIGTVINIGGFSAQSSGAIAYANSNIRPHALDPFIFAEEGLTFKAEIVWSTAQAVTNASLLGVYLLGGKYDKG